MSLIDEVGANYFTEMCANALFLKDGKLHKVDHCSSQGVICIEYNDTSTSVTEVPREFFTGWKVFEYPVLGYRRFSDHLIGYIQRRQSTRRGLRVESMNIQLTPCSNLLQQMRVVPPFNNAAKERAAMLPRFDSLEEDLPRLLSGEKSGLILSDGIVIEPDVDGNKANGYNIFLRQHIIGRMSDNGSIAWESKEMSNLLDRFTKKKGMSNG